MTHCQNWDIEKYKSAHEPKHQWQLKKKFMEFHKDRFPEYELVSLHIKILQESVKGFLAQDQGQGLILGLLNCLSCQFECRDVQKLTKLYNGPLRGNMYFHAYNEPQGRRILGCQQADTGFDNKLFAEKA